MSNETISVPREMLQSAYDELTDWNSPTAKKLRAILAQPAEQHQGELVAWVLVRDGEVCYEADDGIVISNVRGDETDLYTWEPVWFGKPAPAAVVLPGRMPTGNNVEGEHNRLSPGVREGWNLCLDEVARLNPPQQ